jgi:Domain of unknown function (DUF222)
MDPQPGQEDEEGAARDRDPDALPDPLPGSARQVPGPARRGPDARLAMFARAGSPDDSWKPPAPSGQLALLVDQLSGPERRCPGATADEKVGLMQTFAAIESWAASGKLGVIRDIMRAEAPPSPGSDHGDLPETWSRSLRYELAGALACSTQSAESIASLAWQLGARLPRISRLLDDGSLTAPKARAVAELFTQLTDPDAATAEAMIADQLAGKTYTQVLRLAEQAALTVDPGLSERWRKHVQENDARVTFFREQAGTAGLSGRDLPPDEALAAMANVNARAEHYKESEAFGDTSMDVLRAQAYLDLINDVPAATRIALAEQQNDADTADAWAAAEPEADATGNDIHLEPVAPANPDDCPCIECDGSCVPHDDADHDYDNVNHDDDGDDDPPGPDDACPDGPGPDSGGPSSRGPGPGGPGGSGGSGPGGSGGDSPRPAGPPTGQARERRPADLVVPLRTMLGLSELPGEIHGFGLLDPALARQLAEAAVASSRTEVCVTVTSPEGYAIGHGCARRIRTTSRPASPAPTATPLPARLNLTIPAAALSGLASLPGNTSSWSLTPRGRPGTEDEFGTWTLVLPGARELAVRIDPVPVFECDHRYVRHEALFFRMEVKDLRLLAVAAAG